MNSNSRFEFKYVLDPLQAMKARNVVAQMLEHDPGESASKGYYIVTSLYFDTPHLTDYYEKSGGFAMRKKLRARIYAPSGTDEAPVFLEIKKKHDMAFQKSRMCFTPNEWQDLLLGRYSALLSQDRVERDRTTLGEFIWYLLQEGRRPLFFIRYRREAYEDEMRRITFDTHIEAARHGTLTSPPFTTPVTDEEKTIMEVKFSSGLPGWFRAMVRELEIGRESFSKYGESIDAIASYNPLPR